jgi:N-acetylmuramoyl-L-alanine amidase
MTTVVLDPGHGGTKKVGGSSPNNATGPTGLLEKTVTLDVARRAAALLTARGVACALTRTSDTNPALAARARTASATASPVFISIHFNGWKVPTTQGTETFWHKNGNERSKRLAGIVQKHLLAATGFKDRSVKQAAFGVLSPNIHDPRTAAVLAEISFLTDPAEEARLKTPAYLDRIADAIADAAQEYLGGAK